MKFGLYVMAALVAGNLALLLAGARVLVFEAKVRPGQVYVVEGYGNLGEASQASLVCRYFTGRAIVAAVFWYAPKGSFGRDSCPVIYRP
jgi:hypothetical protein